MQWSHPGFWFVLVSVYLHAVFSNIDVVWQQQQWIAGLWTWNLRNTSVRSLSTSQQSWRSCIYGKRNFMRKLRYSPCMRKLCYTSMHFFVTAIYYSAASYYIPPDSCSVLSGSFWRNKVFCIVRDAFTPKMHPIEQTLNN